MPKSRNHYKIGINLSRDNTIIKSIDVPFINAAARQLDKVSFYKQKIVITAVRSKKYKANDILSNKGNSLYQQILKSIIYLYVVNGERVRITKIRIERSTTRVHEVVLIPSLSSHGRCPVNSGGFSVHTVYQKWNLKPAATPAWETPLDTSDSLG